MKKKLLFCLDNFNLGGISTAMLSMLKSLDRSKYDITILIEKSEGLFLNSLTDNITIIDYDLEDSSNILIRKLKNRYKLIKHIFKLRNKYDFAACYSPYSIPSTILARYASKNNAIWIHGDYYEMFEHSVLKFKNFFKQIKINKYKNIIFVSRASKINFCNIFPELKEKCKNFNNVIDYERIIEKSKEKINIQKKKTTFLHVGRHKENVKQISMIINVCNRLKKEGFKIEVWLIGDGPDTNKYKNIVKKMNLEKEILFIGPILNPFPYYKKSDALVLCSKFEGNPVVFVEAKTLNKPIITTNVSDALNDIQGKYGIVTHNTEESLYEGMKEFIINGFNIPIKFDAAKYNRDIMKEIEELING